MTTTMLAISINLRRIFSILILFVNLNVYCQFVEVNTAGSCVYKNDGFIELIIDEDSVNYTLPYFISWENITTGDFEEDLEMESLEYIIESLYPGEYEVSIYFNESCKYFIETEVEEIVTEPISFLRKPLNSTCGSADGNVDLPNFGHSFSRRIQI